MPVEILDMRKPGPRPTGPRFGRLLHAVLENGRTNAGAIGRKFAATSEEIEAAERIAAAKDPGAGL
jgi:hypothetical protein